MKDTQSYLLERECASMVGKYLIDENKLYHVLSIRKNKNSKCYECRVSLINWRGSICDHMIEYDGVEYCYSCARYSELKNMLEVSAEEYCMIRMILERTRQILGAIALDICRRKKKNEEL